jgi:hypothetical protein
MCHEHQLIGNHSLGPVSPFDGFNFAKHSAPCHNGPFSNFVSIPRKKVAFTNSSKSVIGAANTLQHPVHRPWAFDLNNPSDFSNVNT